MPRGLVVCGVRYLFTRRICRMEMRFPTVSRVFVFGGSRSFTLCLILCTFAGVALRLVLLRTPARPNLIAVLVCGLPSSGDARRSRGLGSGAGCGGWCR